MPQNWKQIIEQTSINFSQDIYQSTADKADFIIVQRCRYRIFVGVENGQDRRISLPRDSVTANYIQLTVYTAQLLKTLRFEQ